MLQDYFDKISTQLSEKNIKNALAIHYPSPTQEMSEEYASLTSGNDGLFLKELATNYFGINIMWDSEEPLVSASNVFDSMASSAQKGVLISVNGVPEAIFEEGFYPFANRGSSSSIVFKVIDKAICLYLVLPDQTIHELDVGFESYVKLMIQIGGIDLAEIYLTKEFPKSLLNCHYDMFRERVVQYFPDLDFSKFKHFDVAASLPNPIDSMEEYNYAERFRKIFNAIEEGYTIKLNPSKIHEIRRAELQSGYILPPALVAYYLQVGYLGVGYIAPNLPERESHGFSILPLEKVFNGNEAHPATPWNKDLRQYWKFEDGKGENLEGIHPFYINEYGTIGLGFGKKKGVYFINHEYETINLGLSIEALIDEILNTRGFGRWQFCLAYPSSTEDFPEKLRKVFPDADISKYQTI